MGLILLIHLGFAIYVTYLMFTQAPKLWEVSTTRNPDPATWPSVAVVIPCRNEERHLKHALTSVLALEYEPIEIIVVDDRSTDHTPHILAEMQRLYPRLKVVRVDNLPQDWLGKNYALQQGADSSKSELILFTDADVVYRSNTLRQAVSYFVYNKLDHLTMLGRIWSRNSLLQGFINYFAYSLLFFFQPWKCSNKDKPNFMGVGAFNLLSREAYDHINGLSGVKLRPDDDLKLGKLIKKKGLNQDCLSAVKSYSVEWYATFGECIRGLEKNMLAGMDYNVITMILWTPAIIFLHIIPFITPFYFEGVFFDLSLVPPILLIASLGRAAVAQKSLATYAIFYPFYTAFFLYIMIRNSIKTLRDGGIYWRDTFYPLEKLKENEV